MFEEVVTNFLDAEYCPRCTMCKKILSVGPVYSDYTTYICGRCNSNIDLEKKFPMCTRQFVYENLVEHLIFPCSFAPLGCIIPTRFNGTHESNCKYRPLKCPMAMKKMFLLPVKCTWYGSAGIFDHHIAEVHTKLVKKPPFFVLGTLSSQLFITSTIGRNFVVAFLNKSRNKFKVVVATVGTEEELKAIRYQLEFFDRERKGAVVIRPGPVTSLHEMADTVRYNGDIPVIDLRTVYDIVGQCAGYEGKISITRWIPPEARDMVAITIKDEPNLEPTFLNVTLLSDLECPVCNDYMVPPIYICMLGHSVCERCSNFVDGICPTCRGALGKTRNTKLEEVTTKLNYACHFRHLGCRMILPSDELRAHEDLCETVRRECVLKCHWRGTKSEMIEHLRKKHTMAMVNEGCIYQQQIRRPTALPYCAVIHQNEVFRLASKNFVRSGVFKFTMQHLNDIGSPPVYKYSLDFVDKNKLGVAMKMAYLCNNISRLPKESFEDCITFDTASLKPFIKDDIVHFKLNISPIRL